MTRAEVQSERPSDLALVEQVQAGNDAAFDELMARYKSRS